MAVRGSFSSAFTRRNCSHEKVFHSEYQRTNRTKENKILRCFPHCCPEHVRRSYCGSSLHLQVDFQAGDSSSPSGTFRQPTRDDDLLVFGRFRPRESRGFCVGDCIAGAAILSSLQSEDNPTGEWIEAWLIASADRDAWLYEVNHSARWYYNWGSSAAKDKRLKEHVFEVYILYQTSGSLAMADATTEEARAAADSFQVAAVSCSPPFKLLSFRRAPAETRKRGHADANTEQVSLSEEEAAASGDRDRYDGGGSRGLDEEEEEKEKQTSTARLQGTAPAPARVSLTPPPLPIPHHSQDHEFHHWEGSHRHSIHDRHQHHSQHCDQEDRRGGYHHEHRESPSWRSLPPPTHHTTSPIPAPSFGNPKSSVCSSTTMDRFPGSTLPSFSFAAASTATTMAQRTNASFPSFPLFSSSSSFPSMATKRPRNDTSIAHPLLCSVRATVHNSEYPTSSSMWRYRQREAFARLETRSPSPSPHPVFDTARQRQRTQLDDIVCVLTALRLLSLTDAATAVASLESTFRQCATTQLSMIGHEHSAFAATIPPSARTNASRDVERLLAHLGQSPTTTAQRRLPPDLVDATAHLALWLQCDLDLARVRASLHEQAASVLLNKPALAAAHERFVRWLHAQIDAFLLRRCGWSLESFAVEIAHAHRTTERDTDVEVKFDRDTNTNVAMGSGVGFTDFVAQAREVFANDYQRRDRKYVPRSSRLDGVWRSEIANVRVRRVSPVDAVPLDALLWFWKQLDCASISFLVDSSPTMGPSTRVVELRSAFAPASGSGLRLVLDGRARWFRTFPSGESSSATCVATQSFGDYRAVFDAALDSVECAMYSWPSIIDSKSGGYRADAYCWRWQLKPTALGSTTKVAVEVQLVVERGSLERRTSSQALALEPLARKCDRVANWDRVVVADWAMEA